MTGDLFSEPVMLDMTPPSDPLWHKLVTTFMASELGGRVVAGIAADVAAGHPVYPQRVFRAMEETPSSNVRVVILGQDPYHGPGQAEGLSFSVPAGIRVPPALRNIKKELQRDLAVTMTSEGSLLPWARQGVLLLNAILTVRGGEAASHRSLGWEALTDAVIQAVSETVPHAVFMLWGNFAQTKQRLIDSQRHLVLCANHPSPLSALRPPVPFIGCGHFGAANAWLSAHGIKPIDWTV